MSSIEIKVYKEKGGDYFAEFIRKGNKFFTNRYSDRQLAIREAQQLHKYLIDRDNDYINGLQKPRNRTELRRRNRYELITMMQHNNIPYDEDMLKKEMEERLAEVFFKE